MSQLNDDIEHHSTTAVLGGLHIFICICNSQIWLMVCFQNLLSICSSLLLKCLFISWLYDAKTAVLNTCGHCSGGFQRGQMYFPHVHSYISLLIFGQWCVICQYNSHSWAFFQGCPKSMYQIWAGLSTVFTTLF